MKGMDAQLAADDLVKFMEMARGELEKRFWDA
jgi:hypothetical protein